jgi:hypothetical protein
MSLMKLSPALLGLLAVGSMMMIGCGPGLTRQSKSPDAVFRAMDTELAHTLSTTTVTSGTFDVSELPSDRMPMSRLDELEPSAPVLQTWGVAAALPIEENDPYHILDTRD